MGRFFYKKSLNMSPVFYKQKKKSLNMCPIFWLSPNFGGKNSENCKICEK